MMTLALISSGVVIWDPESVAGVPGTVGDQDH